MSSLLALWSIFDLTSNEEYPGRKLMEYFLGTSRNWFTGSEQVDPSAEQLPPFYAYATKALRNLQVQLPGVDIPNERPSKICEALAVPQLSAEQRAKGDRVK